jgi:uncharacterized cupredoxin-like copper-binding protein
MENYMKKPLFFLLLVMSFVLSACGSGGPTNTIDVTLAEFMFTPSEFTIPAGQEIAINATNNGAVIHEFVIMKLGTSVGDNFDDEDEVNIYWEVEVESGQSASMTFTAPSEPGVYEVVCGTAGHYMAGMAGKLNVVASE